MSVPRVELDKNHSDRWRSFVFDVARLLARVEVICSGQPRGQSSELTNNIFRNRNVHSRIIYIKVLDEVRTNQIETPPPPPPPRE